MKLFIIGDSWAVVPNKEYIDNSDTLPDTYHFLLYEKLQADALFVHAMNGTGIDWAVSKYYEICNQITENDCVLWIVTSPTRRWLLKDNPELSNVWMRYDDCDIFPQQRKALEMYRKYLSTEHVDETFLMSLSAAVSYDVMARGASIIQCPGFLTYSSDPNLMTCSKLFNPHVSVYGSMESIGTYNFSNEHDHVKEHDLWIAKAAQSQIDMVRKTGIDNRFNHMSWKNHEEFAERVYQSFVNKKDLDLYKGFIMEPLDTTDSWKNYNSEYLKSYRDHKFGFVFR
jgi:hypothetical protein